MSTFKKLKDTFKEIGTLGYADTETYNPNEVLKKKQEDALGVSFAPKKVSTAPTIDKKQPEYFMPGDNFSTVPGQDLIMKFGEGSTVSRAYLDAASPKLTSSQDDIRDLQKNNDTIKNLAAQGQLTPEDTQQMLDQQKQGMSRADILGRMVSKKRYQLGTRAYAQETKLVDSSGKAEPLINKTNITSLYAPSEIDSYLATKPEIGPEAIDFYKQKKAGGMTGDQIKQDIALNFIQKDIEDEMYDKKDFIEKAFANVGQSAAGTGIDLIASVPHIAAFIANIPAMVSEADLTAETGLGKSINKWTDAKVSGEFKGMGMDTGEVSGDANNNIMAGQVVSTLIGLVYGSSFVKGLTKLPVIAKFPKLAGAINMIVDGGKALEKGAPLSAKTINILQRLGASAIRNGLFTVGASAMLEGKGPTNTQLALGTALGVAGEGAFIAGGKGLEAIGAKVGLSGLFSTKASMGRVKTILSDAYSDEGLKAADIDETFINNWLKAHTRGGEKADMIKDIKQFATGKSADMVTDVMDGMSNGAAIIKDTKGDITGAIEKLIAKTSKGKSADDKLLTKQLEGMLKRIDAEGGIGATEANTVKRLIAERLHPFKQRGIGEPQNLDDAALYNTIKKELEDVADGLGIDIRAVNKEVIEANVISSVLEKEMLKDSMANMSFGDFTKWGAKQAFVKGIQSQFGPFDEDTVTGRISNIAFWQTASVLTKIPGFAIDKTVGLQTFKNWLSRTLTKFSPAEKGALEKFWQDGKAGKFNRTWSEFAQENPAAASASDKMSEALSLFAKENNIELTDGLTDTMIGPKTGKPTTPVDVTLPGGEPSVPAGTAFPAIYDNTISARTSINGSNPNLAASLQEPQLPGSQLSQNGLQPTTGLQGTPRQPGDIAPGQESTGGYVDFSKGTTGANVTEVTPLVNPTPGTSLASTYERGFTLKNGKIDKEFGIKEMLADYKKLSPEEQAIASEINSIKKIIEIDEINNDVKEIEIVSHPYTEEEALEIYQPIIDKIRKGAYTPKELVFINKNAPKSIQNELKNAGNELLGRKPVAPEAKGVKPTETKELPKKVLDIEDEIGMLEDNMGDRSTFVQKYDGADEYGPAGDAYDAVKDMDRFEFEDYDSLWKDKQGGGMVPRNETASKIIDGVDAFANKLGISSDDAIQIVRDGTGGSRYKENLANFRNKYGVAPYQARKALAKFKKDFEAGKNPSIDDFLYKKDNTVDFNRKSKEEMDIENSKTPFDDVDAPKSEVKHSNEPTDNTELTPEMKKIQENISKKDLENVAERFFPQVKEYYADDGIKNYKDYLEKLDTDIIAMELDSDQLSRERIVKLLKGDWEISVDDVVNAYKDNMLRDSVASEVYKPNIGKINDVPVKGKTPFYSPKQVKISQETYNKASEKVTKINKEDVMDARRDLYMEWASNPNLAQQLGISPSELNKKVRSISGSSVEAAKAQQLANRDVPEQLHWNGISNSNFLKKSTVTFKDVSKVVKSIEMKNGKMSSGTEQLSNYIMDTLLSIDTHLKYDDLNFKIATLDKALGQYSNSDLTITIDRLSKNTVAHEIGHYLDYRFARELGMDNMGLSDGRMNYEYLKEKHNLGDDHIAWAKEFTRFVDNLSQKGEIGSSAKRAEYLQTPTEVFARFTAKFVDWTASKTGYHHPEIDYYSDKFAVSDFYHFIKLLQKKGEIDAVSPRKPLVGGNKNSTTISDSPPSQKSEVKYSKPDLASEAKKYKSAEEFVKAVGKGEVKTGDFPVSTDRFFGKNSNIGFGNTGNLENPNGWRETPTSKATIDYWKEQIRKGERPVIQVSYATENGKMLTGKVFAVKDGNHRLQAYKELYKELGIKEIPINTFSDDGKVLKKELTDLYNSNK